MTLDLCLCRAAVEENAYNRMKQVVRWYISGFYKKPKVRGHTPPPPRPQQGRAVPLGD